MAQNITQKNYAQAKSQFADEFESIKYEKSTGNVLKAFIPKPKNINFDFQHANEEIFLVLRQHPITQFKTIFILLFSILIIPWLLKNSGLLALLPNEFQVLLYIFLAVIFFGVTLNAFLLWFFSVNIITNERIIDVDFLSMIYKNISVAENHNIQDVTKKTSGAMASVFNYSTIYVQTAGVKNEFEFENVPYPDQVIKLMNEIMNKQKTDRQKDNQPIKKEEEENS